MKISILGTGRWASCIAYCMEQNDHDILMWERPHTDRAESNLYRTHTNQYVHLSNKVSFTHDLNKVVNFGDIVIISILSQKLDDLMQSVKRVKGYEIKKYCICMKGIEATTGRRLSEILMDNGIKKHNIAVWVGPGHVQSITAGKPTNMVISAYERAYSRELVKIFEKKNFMDIYNSKDIIGTEYAAAAKNVYGIAAGVLEGSGFEQKKGPLMVAAVKEMAKFIDAVGGDRETAEGLALLGDFQATLFDKNSKNLTYGKLIVEMASLDKGKIQPYVDVESVEGIMTSKALLKRLSAYNKIANDDSQVKMPIIEAVNKIVNGGVNLEQSGEYVCRKITEALEL